MSAHRFAVVGIVFFLFNSLAAAQQCPYGEAPAELCSQPRIIPWSVGQHVLIVDPGQAGGAYELCGIATGRTVWFQFTAAFDAPVTISTCHPATTYDTLLEVWRGGEESCEFMMNVDCNDDTMEPLCENGCFGAGSEVTFNALEGERYRFAVGAYHNNSAGCPMCLGVIVTIGYPCGDPPRNLSCELARELPGTPGMHHAQYDVGDAFVLPSEPDPLCGFNVGHTVWFEVTPLVHGPMTFSTCTPWTAFDTVVQAYTGSCPGPLAAGECNDDYENPSCFSACNVQRPVSSQVTVFGEKNQTYYFQVGSYSDNAAGCPLCVGATLTIEDICETDTTPPVAEITSPADFACTCSQMDILGTADDPDGTWGRRILEFRPVSGGLWQTISNDLTPVVDGVLGTWNTAALSDGWYLLRLTATNICERSSTAVRIVRVDKSFGSLSLRSPANGTILGGVICADGTAWDDCFQSYSVQRRPMGGAFVPFDPAHPTYPAAVLNDPLATWSSTTAPDGDYEAKLTGTTICSNSNSVSASFVVDNTAPIAIITSPSACDAIDGVVPISGIVADAHLAGWVLQYTGGDAQAWVTIASGNAPINGVLANWNVAALPPCAYVLRLIATDATVLNCNGALHNQSEYTVGIMANWEAIFDADGDGDVDLHDFSAFLGAFHGPNVP